MRLLSLFVISCLFIGCQSSDTTSTGTEQSSPAESTMEMEESTTEETTIVEDIEEPTEMVEPREIEISAYINDPDTENPTNVRSTPGGDVVLKLETSDYLLDLSIVENGWFKIDGNIDNVEGIIEIPGGEGWIHGSVLEVGSRNYGGQELLLYQSANEDSKVVYSFSN